MTGRGDRWTPILNGEFYCSPRCGGGKYCKREWYDRAVDAADKLCARMGPGWVPEVWENLGWYWRIRCSDATIRQTDGRYHCAIEPPSDVIRGAMLVQFFADAETPQDALGFCVQEARTYISRIEQSLTAILEADPQS